MPLVFGFKRFLDNKSFSGFKRLRVLTRVTGYNIVGCRVYMGEGIQGVGFEGFEGFNYISKLIEIKMRLNF